MPRGQHLAEVGQPYRFKKGKSGNPGGRPKSPLTDLTREQIARNGSEILNNLWHIATHESGPEAIAAAKLLWAYAEGQPVARSESGEPGDFDLGLGEPEKRWRILELQERWVGDVLKLTAVYPRVGNLAEVQQLAELKENQLAMFEDVIEENPEAESGPRSWPIRSSLVRPRVR